jgi:endonuclease/exonuclease/phosphatase family metal-dependent hydrolase
MAGTIVRARARHGRGTRARLALAVAAMGALLASGSAGCLPGLEEDDEPRPLALVDGVEIATWNLAWLHGEDGKGTIARREADYARLRAYAARLDADLVALQEVGGEDAAARVLDPAVYTFAIARQRDAQRTGFAYRRSLSVTRHADVVALDVGGLRHGVDVTVHLGGSDLRLLAVHLKSGCFDGALGRGGKACAKLREQLPALEAWIDAREREGVPFAVLGDFNRRLRRDDEVWRELDDRDPVPAELTLATDGQRSRCWNGKYPDFIDHIVLDAQAAAWLVPGSFEQMLYDPADARHKDTLSDHCPISVRLALAGSRAARPGPGPRPGPVAGAAPGPAAGQASERVPDKAQGHASGPEPEPEPGEAGATAGRGAAPKPGGTGGGTRGGTRAETGTGTIKGNVSRGRKLYHLPECPSYAEVRIEPERGERLFASEREARAAGFQKAGNCP